MRTPPTEIGGDVLRVAVVFANVAFDQANCRTGLEPGMRELQRTWQTWNYPVHRCTDERLT